MRDQFLKDNPSVALRSGPPNKKSCEPYGFQWHLVNPHETTKVYIQTSKDERNPRWKRFSDMLEVTYFETAQNPVFVEALINRYLTENKLL